MEPVDGIAALAGDDEVPDLAPRGPVIRDMVVTTINVDGRSDRVTDERMLMMDGPPAWSHPQCFEGFEDGPIEALDPDDPDNPFVVRLPPGRRRAASGPGDRRGPDRDRTRPALRRRRPAVDPLLLVDDPFAVRETLDNARELSGENGEAFDDAAVELDVIVFLSTVEAAYEYTLETSNLTLDEQFGRAHFVDGTWRITCSTLCRDLGYYGVICPP